MVDIAKMMNLQVGDFRNFIEKLNVNGIVLKNSNKTYTLCT
jgi:hypothetical protein